MIIRKKKIVKDLVFCFLCGEDLTINYQLDLGTPATTFDLCRGCLRKLYNRAGKALDKQEAAQ